MRLRLRLRLRLQVADILVKLNPQLLFGRRSSWSSVSAGDLCLCHANSFATFFCCLALVKQRGGGAIEVDEDVLDNITNNEQAQRPGVVVDLTIEECTKKVELLSLQHFLLFLRPCC
jgi:hypothetical protein